MRHSKWISALNSLILVDVLQNLRPNDNNMINKFSFSLVREMISLKYSN